MSKLALARCLTLIVAFAAMSLSVRAADEPAPEPDVRAALSTLIPKAIAMLEAKEYRELIEMLAPPDVVKKMKESGEFERVVENFGQKKAGRLLTVLRQVKDAEPTYNDEKNKATYKVDPPVAGKDSVEFLKVDGLWYLGN